MNKSQKPTKGKRGKRVARPKTQPQDLVESEVENARKAVERKLIYLSESNGANPPPRPEKRSTGGAGSGGGGTNTHGGRRRKHGKKHLAQAPPKEITDDEEETLQEKAYKYENRRRGGYNVLLESPRRNGLTPRDYEAEAAEMAALLAAQRTSSGTTKPGQIAGEGRENLDGEFGRLQLKPLSSYAPNHHHLPSYSCSVCGAKFHIRSLLGAHRRTHDDDFKVRFRGRRPPDSSTTLTAANLCKFCDRRFDLERTLHIHQLCHCKKISPQQRRKLAFTELAHEKKAPLPSFQRAQNSHRLQGNIAPSTKPPLTQQQQLHKTIMQSSAVHERWR
ncbi:uncharacterized protein LOC119557045 [Drosophila subpulchrella]|uniref:uncharacterized protein LOC119557045 n=1 Tax=Drosophila subpulchrella TaxID=1486046 RepID=UPI0018A1B440|nr:uncharacterized protein LOC119557045 [Drosophila subpulchrella]